MLKSQRRTTGVGILIAEAVLIMLSVASGLMANEWRVSRDNEKEALTALEFIREEIETNHDKVNDVIGYHEQIQKSLTGLMNQVFTTAEPVSTQELFQAMPEGFTVPLVSRNSWELVNQTGAINHVDFELALELSQLYDQQEFYEKKVDLLGVNLYVANNINTKDQSGSAVAFRMLANDILIQEKRLINRYGDAMARMDSVLMTYKK